MRRITFLVGWLGCLALLLPVSTNHAANPEIYEDAVAAFRKPDYELAAKKFEALLTESPSWAQGYVALGQCYYMLGRPGPAESNIGRASEYDPEVDLFRAYFGAGDLLYKQKRFDEAVGPLSKALNHAPAPYKKSTSLRLAHAYLVNRQSNEAIRALQRHHDEHGVDFDSAYFLAMACHQRKEYDCAVRNMRTARVLEQADERDPKLLEHLAKWSHTLALLPESEDRRDELLSQAVKDTGSWFETERENAAALRYYTETLIAADQEAIAIRELAPLARRDAKNCTARLMLARAFNSRADGPEAANWAKQAAECDPEMAGAHVELAVAAIHRLRSEHSDVEEVRRDQDLTREALASLKRARELEPGEHPRAETLLADARTTQENLRQTEAEFVARDRAHQDAIQVAQLKEARQRCKGILWTIDHDPGRLSPEDEAFHEEYDCKQYARQTAAPTE